MEDGDHLLSTEVRMRQESWWLLWFKSAQQLCCSLFLSLQIFSLLVAHWCQEPWFSLLHLRRQWHPTPALLPGKSHGRSSLVGCSPCGGEESDPTERLHFHFSLSCIGEGNGNPLQCSCLENPRDKGAWWAAIYGVTQSQTRLKRLSSSATWEARNIYKEKRIIKTVFTSLVDVRICLYGNSQRRLMLCYSLTSIS